MLHKYVFLQLVFISSMINTTFINLFKHFSLIKCYLLKTAFDVSVAAGSYGWDYVRYNRIYVNITGLGGFTVVLKDTIS